MNENKPTDNSFENMIKEFDVETKSDVFLEINVFGKQFVALFNDFLLFF